MAAFAPDIITHIGAFPLTNTFMDTLLVDAGLLGGTYYLTKHIKTIPNFFQNTVEIVIEGFYDLGESVAGANIIRIFPWFMSFFLFILVANWSGLIPGIGTFGFYETVDGQKELIPFFRNTTSDLNTTFGLALISLVATHTLAVQAVGWKEYLSRYFSFNPIMLFVGALEIFLDDFA